MLWRPILLGWVWVRRLELSVSAPSLRPFEVSARAGELWLWFTQWVMLSANWTKVLSSSRNSASVWIPIALPGREWILMHRCLLSSLRQICFPVTSVSLAFDVPISNGWNWKWFQVLDSVYPSDQSLSVSRIEGCVGLVITWLILPVVICLSQRLSHACLSISFTTAKLRMAH